MGAQAVQIRSAGGVRQLIRRGQPPHGHAGGHAEVVAVEQAFQREVVPAEMEHAAFKALAVAVPRAVNAALEDMRGRERFQLLGIGGKQQADARAAMQEHHIQLARVLAEYAVQAGRRGGIGVQPDMPQRAAVHQRVAAKVAHRAGERQPLEAAAVVKRMPAHALQAARQGDRADGVCIVHGFRPAAGDAHRKGLAAREIGRAFAERIGAERNHRRAADLVRQAHGIVPRFAPQDGSAVRRLRAGQQQLVFALDRAHGAPSFHHVFCSALIIAQPGRHGNKCAVFLSVLRIDREVSIR